MARMKTRSSSAKEEVGEPPVDQTSETPEIDLPLYKDDSNAFNISVEDGKDYISKIPSELLDRILGYCVMDHEPELAVRQKEQGDKFVKHPHVLLSLAAMSKHFRDHVEMFCRFELTRNKDEYRFKTTAEIVEKGNLRRSPRIKTKPAVDPRCYRMELVEFLQTRCVQCGFYTNHFATMTNSVKCHISCEYKVSPGLIDLSTALYKYDLRDWMLIKSRKPGPRTKKIDLPNIRYGTVRSGTPICIGTVTSYRFYEAEVKAIAQIVHGNVDEHMTAKNKQRVERKAKKRRHVHRELKIRYHTDQLESFAHKHADEDDEEDKEYHQEQLTYYSGADWDEDGDSDIGEPEFAYGGYEDVHRRLCVHQDEFCDHCWDAAFWKYHGW